MANKGCIPFVSWRTYRWRGRKKKLFSFSSMKTSFRPKIEKSSLSAAFFGWQHRLYFWKSKSLSSSVFCSCLQRQWINRGNHSAAKSLSRPSYRHKCHHINDKTRWEELQKMDVWAKLTTNNCPEPILGGLSDQR